MNQRSWYDISKVIRGTSKVVQANIDAVFADGIQDAIRKASLRNGWKPWEEFGVCRARGAVGLNQSIARHDRRSNQIEDLKEQMEANV